VTALSGCAGLTGMQPPAAPTRVAEVTAMPNATVTVEPTILPSATATASPATPVPTPTPVPTVTATLSSAPIYTMSCTFTSLVLNSNDSAVTDISGSLTDSSTGSALYGNAVSDTYQFSHVPAGHYDLALDVQYTIYYVNNTTETRNTRITDSFDLNGNVDKTYQLN